MQAIKFFFYITSFFFLSLGCKKADSQVDSKPTKINQTKKVDVKASETLFELGKFLNGTLQNSNRSNLDSFLKANSYKLFQVKIKNRWTNYLNSIYLPLVEWRKNQLKEEKPKTVVYPFSGPDFPNAFALYPDADFYIMLGLEAGGFEPNLEKMEHNKIAKGLNEFLDSIESISRLNYFMTNKMKKNISASIFKGTLPVIVGYLEFLGFVPLEARPIIIGSNGDILYLSSDDILKNPRYTKGFFSLEIIFKEKSTDKIKTLYFLSTNVANSELEKNSGVTIFLERFGSFACTFKAASYLLHYAHFSKFKEFILSNSETIVMDDTGPPIKDLQKNFTIQVFGKYTRPIRLWKTKYQTTLSELHNEQNSKPISFKYGYGTLNHTHHILIAKRKKKNATQ